MENGQWLLSPVLGLSVAEGLSGAGNSTVSFPASVVGGAAVAVSTGLCVCVASWSSTTLGGVVALEAEVWPSLSARSFSLAVEAGASEGGSSSAVPLLTCLSTSSAVPFLSFFSFSFSSSSSSFSSSPSRSPSSPWPFPFSPSSPPSALSLAAAALASLVGSGLGEAGGSVGGVWRTPVAEVGLWAALAVVGALVGHTELGKEEITPPLKPRPANRVLVTTDATVAWLPLEEGPMPVAMETNENGRPEEVQVEEPEDMGAISAEEAGETVG